MILKFKFLFGTFQNICNTFFVWLVRQILTFFVFDFFHILHIICSSDTWWVKTKQTKVSGTHPQTYLAFKGTAQWLMKGWQQLYKLNAELQNVYHCQVAYCTVLKNIRGTGLPHIVVIAEPLLRYHVSYVYNSNTKVKLHDL